MLPAFRVHRWRRLVRPRPDETRCSDDAGFAAVRQEPTWLAGRQHDPRRNARARIRGVNAVDHETVGADATRLGAKLFDAVVVKFVRVVGIRHASDGDHGSGKSPRIMDDVGFAIVAARCEPHALSVFGPLGIQLALMTRRAEQSETERQGPWSHASTPETTIPSLGPGPVYALPISSAQMPAHETSLLVELPELPFVSKAALSSDARLAAFGHANGNVAIWDLTKMKRVASVRTPLSQIFGLVSVENDWIAAGPEGVARIHGARVEKLRLAPAARCLALAGGTLLVGHDDESVSQLDLENGKVRKISGCGGAVVCVVGTADRSRVVTSAASGVISLFDGRNGKRMAAHGVDGAPGGHIALDEATGRALVVLRTLRGKRVYESEPLALELQSGAIVRGKAAARRKAPKRPSYRTLCWPLAFDAATGLVIGASGQLGEENTLFAWSADGDGPAAPTATLATPCDAIWQLCVSTTARRALVGETETFVLVDLDAFLKHRVTTHGEAVSELSLSSDGRRALAVGPSQQFSERRIASVWDVAQGRELFRVGPKPRLDHAWLSGPSVFFSTGTELRRTVDGKSDVVARVPKGFDVGFVAPDGRAVATSAKAALRIAGKTLPPIELEGAGPPVLLDGDELYVCTHEEVVRSSFANGRVLARYPLRATRRGRKADAPIFEDLAPSPDGRHLLAFGTELALWNCETKQRLDVPLAAPDGAAWIDEDNLVTFGRREVVAWNVSKGKQVWRVESPRGSFFGRGAVLPETGAIAVCAYRRIEILSSDNGRTLGTLELVGDPERIAGAGRSLVVADDRGTLSFFADLGLGRATKPSHRRKGDEPAKPQRQPSRRKRPGK